MAYQMVSAKNRSVKLNGSSCFTKQRKSSPAKRDGLILLIVLGMLGLFSLLAVTYVVAATSSRKGSQAGRVKANNDNVTVKGTAHAVAKQIIRGTNDQRSALYKGSLLEDIYDPKGIRVKFGHIRLNQEAARGTWCTSIVNGMVKVSLDPRDSLSGAQLLSDYENAYNSRILTVLEGPLAGQSLRILKYVGYVRGETSTKSDPNFEPKAYASTYTDSGAHNYDFSVLLDLSELQDSRFTGQWRNPANGLIESFTGTIPEWISLPNGRGVFNLFFFCDTPPNVELVGYGCLINGGAYTNAGIGLEDIAGNPGFGTIDSRRLMAIPSLPTRKIPPALLPHYDYLQNPNYMVGTGVSRIGERQNPTDSVLVGGSNEPFDVADFNDFWLAHQSSSPRRTATPGVYTYEPNIIPSFHRPELVYYIANLFGDPNMLSAGEVSELIRTIDASTARVMSYSFGQPNPINPDFKPNPDYPQLPANFTWSSPSPTPAEVTTLQTWVRNMIIGQWDVDNDGDGIRDSVYTDTNLPTVYSPTGKLLKPLTAILIEDLDGRVNLNLHGDRFQGLSGYDAYANDVGYLRNGSMVHQGFGYGPADISLTPVLSTPAMTSVIRNNTSFGLHDDRIFTLFDDRYGARRYLRRPTSFADLTLDIVPGRRAYGTFNGDDYTSQIGDRENHNYAMHGRLPGMPIGKRSSVAATFDRHGNLAFVNPSAMNGNPYSFGTSSQADPNIDDPYEFDAGSDDPLGLAELEAVLRRFDSDASSLPNRIRRKLQMLPGYTNISDINRLITTRSAELRYPSLAAAAVMPGPSNTITVDNKPGNLIGLIRMLHEQRYRVRTLPSNSGSDDPALAVASIYELFPSDFSKGLRLDLNRPFGNGLDDDNDGQVDEPQELATSLEVDPFPSGSTSQGVYRREQVPMSSTSRNRLGSRQILARQLYCLAQLLIPRDYAFAGMTPSDYSSAVNKGRWYRQRAAAIAQWAVNVVDFRDADAACTRFEYDIMPFGNGDATIGTAREAFWMPDRQISTAAEKAYVGVAWGMEMPELLLTESLAFHDKRLKDTDLDPTGTSTTDPSTPDNDLDQFRFPQGSLFLELYGTRTTDVSTTNILPGVPSSLYSTSSITGKMALDLQRMAPSAGATWGSQPVWRIGISSYIPPAVAATTHPNVMLQSGGAAIVSKTNQVSSNASLTGVLGSANPEIAIGSGLYSDNTAATVPPTPLTFDRMVWFTSNKPSTDVPDLAGASVAEKAHRVYYNRTSHPGGALLHGGQYLVVGPRNLTNLGSTANKPFEPGGPSSAAYPPQLLKASMMSSPYPPIYSPSPQSIEINSDGSNVKTYLLNGETIFKSNTDWITRAPLGMVCATSEPVDPSPVAVREQWKYCFEGVGLNISMPHPIYGNGYWSNSRIPLWAVNANDTQGAGRPDGSFGYGNHSTLGSPVRPDSWFNTAAATGTDPDGPFTAFTGGNPNTLPDTPFDYDPLLSPDLAGNGMAANGTYTDVRVAYLQRLADPEMPYDPIVNPYLTVDWISLDLTVFNGEAPVSGTGSEASAPPPGFATGAPTTGIAFQSRYKDGDIPTTGGKASVAAAGQPGVPAGIRTRGMTYHSFSTAQLRASFTQPAVPPLVTPIADVRLQPRPSYFMHQLGYTSAHPSVAATRHSSASTLGYVNVGYKFGTIVTIANDSQDSYDGFGPPMDFANDSFDGAARDITSVAWFNRPFATPYELTMVPLTAPGQFGLFHNALVTPSSNLRKPFDFLPSFQTMNAWKTTGDTGLPISASASGSGAWMKRDSGVTAVEADWPLLLEFVETPPPFVDANRNIEPNKILAASVASPLANRFLNSYFPVDYPVVGLPATVRGPSYLAPFNQIPSYVAPGKINVNTIAQDSFGRVSSLEALEHNYLIESQRTTSDPLTNKFMDLRRGYTLGQSSSFFGASIKDSLNPSYPTQFAGAYRPASVANIAPQANNPTVQSQLRGKFGMESTLLRSYNLNVAAIAPPPSNMLFSPDSVLKQEDPTFPATTITMNQTTDSSRNAFTRMQRAARLPNIATNQSNVFAVWVTVSLFEYDPIKGFGREFLDETGQPKRERAFFIIDRSVPVGFIPGEDLNTEKMILLERKLQ